MSWAGGVFTRVRNWVTDKANAINPQAALFDQEDDNFAAGLNNCVTKDGLNKPSSTMDWNNQRISNLGAGTARTDAAQVAQIQDGIVTNITAVAGTDTITGTLTPAILAYAVGMKLSFTPANTNTGAATINLNSLGAKSIVKFNGNALIAGDLAAGVPAAILYNGTSFYLLNPLKTPDAALSASVALIGSANVFTAAQRVTVANAVVGLRIAGATGMFRVRGYVDGTFGAILDSIDAAEGTNLPLTISSTTIGFTAPTLITPNASASEVGFKGIPQIGTTAGNYTFVLTDANESAVYNGTGGHTFTIPANASVAFPVGTTLHFAHIGSGNLSIAITTDTLRLAGSGTTGTRTLGPWGRVTAEKISSTVWLIYGTGIS